MSTVDGTALGIDFGTSNTVAVVTRPDRPPAPLLFDGSPLLPSAVYAADDRILAGRVALRSAAIDPARCEPHPKRCIDDGTVLLGEREYTVVDVFTAVFARVADETRRVLGGLPAAVVVTHPVGWGTLRQGTLRAAVEAAELPAPALVPEPVAGAAYFLDPHEGRLPEGRQVLIYDLGGGTCDLTLVRRAGTGIQVVATDGVSDAGGTYLDAAIVDHLERTFPGATGQWLRLREPRDKTDRRHRRMLWDDVREAKESLSSMTTADLFLPLLDIDVHVTRGEVEALAHDHIKPTIDLAAGLVASHRDVAAIFLVGGASRMPLVATELLRSTGIAPVVVEQPELAVAGGALTAASLIASTATAIPKREATSTAAITARAAEAEEPSAGPRHRSPIAPKAPGTRAIAIRPDGRVWAYVADRVLRVWDSTTGTDAPHGEIYRRRFEGLNSETIAWSPSGLVLAIAKPGNEIELLNPHVARIRPLGGHRGPISALAWSPDGRYLASATTIGEVFLRPTKGGTVIPTPAATPGTSSQPLDPGGITRLVWSPDGSRLAIIGRQGVAYLWQDGRITPRPGVCEVAFRSDATLIEVTTDGLVRSYDPTRERVDDLLDLGKSRLTLLRGSPDGHQLAATLSNAGGGFDLWRWDRRDQTDVCRRTSGAPRTSLSWTPDGNYLVTADGADRHPVQVSPVTGAMWRARTQ